MLETFKSVCHIRLLGTLCPLIQTERWMLFFQKKIIRTILSHINLYFHVSLFQRNRIVIYPTFKFFRHIYLIFETEEQTIYLGGGVHLSQSLPCSIFRQVNLNVLHLSPFSKLSATGDSYTTFCWTRCSTGLSFRLLPIHFAMIKNFILMNTYNPWCAAVFHNYIWPFSVS